MDAGTALRRSGHARIETFELYNRATDRLDESAAELVGDMFQGRRRPISSSQSWGDSD